MLFISICPGLHFLYSGTAKKQNKINENFKIIVNNKD